jgi:transcriptional regulator with XRE-family HTH domain
VRQLRIEKLLQALAGQGLSQNEIANRTGVAASYLTDVKRGTRSLTELFARRLAEEFHLDYRWLLGETGTMESFELGKVVVDKESSGIWLPMFRHLVRGQPRSRPKWDGTCVEVCGVAAAHARTAIDPYVLQFRGKDPAGQLQRDDLLLISQTVKDLAKIQVVRVGRRLQLARKLPQGGWDCFVESGDVDKVFGHVLGIVWRSLG